MISPDLAALWIVVGASVLLALRALLAAWIHVVVFATEADSHGDIIRAALYVVSAGALLWAAWTVL